MKKYLFFLLLAFGSTTLLAQQDSSASHLSMIQTIPAIRVNIVPDSSVFSNAAIKKNTPFVVMFFSPECEHCQKEVKDLMAYKQELKGIQILMVSALSFKEIKEFYDSYGLAAMPNVKVGQDLNIKLGLVYRVRTFPSIYVYDKAGKLAKAFVGNTGAQAILDAVK